MTEYDKNKINGSCNDNVSCKYKSNTRRKYTNLKTLEDFVEFYTKEIDPEWKDRGKALSTTKIKEKEYGGFLARLRNIGYKYNRFVEEGLGIEPNMVKRHRYSKLNKLEDFVEFYKKEIDPEWKDGKKVLTTKEIVKKGYGRFLGKLKEIGYTYNHFVEEGLKYKPAAIKHDYTTLKNLDDFVRYYKENIDPELEKRGKALTTIELRKKRYSGFLTRLMNIGYTYNKFVEEGLGIEPNKARRYTNLKTLEDFVEFYTKEIDPEWKDGKKVLTTKEIVKKGYDRFLGKLKEIGYTYNKFVAEGLGTKPNLHRKYTNLKTLEDFVEFYTKEIDPEWKDRGRVLNRAEVVKKGHIGFLARLRNIGYTYNMLIKKGFRTKQNKARKIRKHNYTNLKTLEDFARYYKENIDPEWKDRGRALTTSEIVKIGHSGFLARLTNTGYKYYLLLEELGFKPNRIRKHSYKGLKRLDDFVEFYKKNIDPKLDKRGRALNISEIIESGHSRFISKLREIGYTYTHFVEQGLRVKPYRAMKRK